MKYKVGDKVEIINTGKIYSTYEGWFDCNCPNYKEQYVLFKSPKNGDVGKVVAMHMHKRLSDGMLCAIKIDDSIYLIGIDGIKYLGKSEFSKSDLKTGMFVTVRNGGGYRLLLGTENGDYGLNQVNGHYIKLKCYNDDLTDKNSREWDIVKVESVKYPENIKTKTPWERKESPIEITIEEIAKKFNVSPDLTRIKE